MQVALGLPFVFLGWGTDIDVPGSRGAGRAILRWDYRVSRNPGAVVHEAAVGVLDRIGGSVASNLGSLAMAAVAIATLVRLLQRAGTRRPGVLAVAVVVSPYWWIAATSTVDFCWAIALALLGVEQVLHRTRWWLGAPLLALAMACRASTVVLVLALGVALVTGPPPRPIRRAVTLVAATLLLAIPLFLPAWEVGGRGTGLLSNVYTASTPLVQIGRWGIKNLLLIGVPGWAVVLTAGPRVVAAVRVRWRSSPVLRFALIGALLSEALYVRFPWKIGHLLPVLVCGALALGVARPALRTRLLALLIVSQLVYGIVNVRFVAPDRPNRATGARISVGLELGPLANDVRCRIRDLRHDEPDAVTEAEANWACSLAAWRGAGEPTAVPGG